MSAMTVTAMGTATGTDAALWHCFVDTTGFATMPDSMAPAATVDGATTPATKSAMHHHHTAHHHTAATTTPAPDAAK